MLGAARRRRLEAAPLPLGVAHRRDAPLDPVGRAAVHPLGALQPGGAAAVPRLAVPARARHRPLVRDARLAPPPLDRHPAAAPVALQLGVAVRPQHAPRRVRVEVAAARPHALHDVGAPLVLVLEPRGVVRHPPAEGLHARGALRVAVAPPLLVGRDARPDDHRVAPRPHPHSRTDQPGRRRRRWPRALGRRDARCRRRQPWRAWRVHGRRGILEPCDSSGGGYLLLLLVSVRRGAGRTAQDKGRTARHARRRRTRPPWLPVGLRGGVGGDSGGGGGPPSRRGLGRRRGLLGLGGG